MIRCSVVIPTFNRSESLMRTLEALVSQTVLISDFEVVVVSDGSTDDTIVKLESFKSRNNLKLHIIDQPNSGPAAARNKGYKSAESEIIVFTDDDVEPVPCFLERHLSHHIDTDSTIVLGPLSPNPKWTASEPVWIAWEHAQLQNIYNMFKPGGEFHGSNAGFEHFYSGNVSLNKKWIDHAGGFSTVLRRQEDTELAARIAKLGEVKFVWDFNADGLHHPVRTLESWMKIPVSYGEVDAQRVLSGDLDASFVEGNNQKRHAVTRSLTVLCSFVPRLAKPMSQLLCRFSTALYQFGFAKIAHLCLSGAYNILYMWSYKRTMEGIPQSLAQAT